MHIIVFAVLGFLSPANRGALMTAMLILFVLLGYVKIKITSLDDKLLTLYIGIFISDYFCSILAGYFSARTYKSFKGQDWKRMHSFGNIKITALLLYYFYLDMNS